MIFFITLVILIGLIILFLLWRNGKLKGRPKLGTGILHSGKSIFTREVLAFLVVMSFFFIILAWIPDEEADAFWGSNENAFWLVTGFVMFFVPSWLVIFGSKSLRIWSVTSIVMFGIMFMFFHEDGKNYGHALKYNCGGLKTGLVNNDWFGWRRVTLKPNEPQEFIVPYYRKGVARGMYALVEVDSCGPLVDPFTVTTWDVNDTMERKTFRPEIVGATNIPLKPRRDINPMNRSSTFEDVVALRFESEKTVILKVRTASPM